MQSVTASIRAKLVSNALPRTRPERWTLGKGDGRLCSGCDTPIDPVQFQYELDFGGESIVRLHADCEQIWRAETAH